MSAEIENTTPSVATTAAAPNGESNSNNNGGSPDNATAAGDGAVTVSDDEIPTTNGESATNTAGGGDGDGARPKRNNYNKRDERPVEEVYDLTKPIPRVEKPDKEAFDKQLQEISAAIDVIKDARTALQEKIEATMAASEAKSGIQAARNKLSELKSLKNALIEEKKAMRTQLDAAKNQTDKLLSEKKNTKSNVRFSSIDEIDTEINRLQRRQETTSMSLSEEKKLIKEIENLRASKKFVADLKSTDASIDDVKEQKKNITQLIAAKDKEIDEYSRQIKVIMESIDQLNQKESQKKDATSELFKERDDLRKEMNLKLAEKDALRNEFREKNDEFYLYQRAVRKQKQMQYEEEKRKRDEEKAAYLAKLEAEEAKKIPYEEEQGLCDFLADYLERTYLKKGADAENESESTKKTDVVAVTENPFDGLIPVNKKEEEDYFGKGKGKKKRTRQTKKQDTNTGPFTLSVDTFEQFGLIQLIPPTSIDQVEASVKELREKKEWYKNQPRGSVPTATEIRKANEKAALKLRNESEVAGTGSRQSTGGKGKNSNSSTFALSNDDFVPLGAATASTSLLSSTGINSSWGKVTVPVSNETPTPAEAAAAAAGSSDDPPNDEAGTL